MPPTTHTHTLYDVSLAPLGCHKGVIESLRIRSRRVSALKASGSGGRILGRMFDHLISGRKLDTIPLCYLYALEGGTVEQAARGPGPLHSRRTAGSQIVGLERHSPYPPRSLIEPLNPPPIWYICSLHAISRVIIPRYDD